MCAQLNEIWKQTVCVLDYMSEGCLWLPSIPLCIHGQISQVTWFVQEKSFVLLLFSSLLPASLLLHFFHYRHVNLFAPSLRRRAASRICSSAARQFFVKLSHKAVPRSPLSLPRLCQCLTFFPSNLDRPLPYCFLCRDLLLIPKALLPPTHMNILLVGGTFVVCLHSLSIRWNN